MCRTFIAGGPLSSKRILVGFIAVSMSVGLTATAAVGFTATAALHTGAAGALPSRVAKVGTVSAGAPRQVILRNLPSAGTTDAANNGPLVDKGHISGSPLPSRTTAPPSPGTAHAAAPAAVLPNASSTT